jgi:hypothetical protein
MKYRKILLMLSVILLATNFYQLNILLEYSNFFKILGLILIVLIVIFNKKTRSIKSYNKLIRVYFLGIFISAFFCYLYWGQSIITSVFALKTYYFMFFYYAIHVLKPSIKEINFTIITVAVGYIIAYFIDYLSFPDIIFGIKGRERRGTISFTIAGVTFMIYALFLSFYKIRFFKKYRYIFLLTLCFIVLLTRASRNAIFAVTLSILVFSYLQTKGFEKKIFNVLFFLIVGGIIHSGFAIFFDGLFLKLESDLSEGDNYVRIRSAYYYIFEHSPSFWNNIFGNGWFSGSSDYGQYMMESMWERRGLYAEDIGLIGFWSYFGVITITAYFLMLRKLLKKYNFLTIRMFAFYLVFMSFATMDSYQLDGIIIQSMLFYISDISLTKGNKWK